MRRALQALRLGVFLGEGDYMIIVLDVGNTNTKIGIFDGDTAVRSLRLSSSVNQTSDEYGFYLVNMLKDSGIRHYGRNYQQRKSQP